MALRRRVTLTDVADRAGVSATTASYILNDRSAQMRIAAGTEERVRRVARELGYRPNRSARSLRTASTATVGLISDFVAGGHFASQLLSGANEGARASDHLLVIGESEGDADVEKRLVEEMLDRQVDAIVYATVTTSEVRLPDALLQHRVVLLNCLDPAAQVLAVVPDELEGGRTAGRLVVESAAVGPVAVIGHDATPDAFAARLRVQGVQQQLAAAGRPAAVLVPSEADVVPAYDAVGAWLAAGHRPGALVCLNDRVAMGAYQALADHGLTVPDEVGVISFGASSLATWLRPALTCVALPYAEMGALAVRRVLERPMGAGSEVLRMPMPVHAGGSMRTSARVPPEDGDLGALDS